MYPHLVIMKITTTLLSLYTCSEIQSLNLLTKFKSQMPVADFFLMFPFNAT